MERKDAKEEKKDINSELNELIKKNEELLNYQKQADEQINKLKFRKNYPQ